MPWSSLYMRRAQQRHINGAWEDSGTMSTDRNQTGNEFAWPVSLHPEASGRGKRALEIGNDAPTLAHVFA